MNKHPYRIFVIGTAVLLIVVSMAGVALAQETPKSVRPIVECVEETAEGTFIARFSYLNENAEVVEIPVGANNRIHPAPQDRGQVTVFQPGRVGGTHSLGAFSVPFESGNVLWILRGPDGTNRTATAGVNTKRCPEPIVEQLPVEQPPVEQPPVEQPPVEQPPVEQPPVEQPPVDEEPGDNGGESVEDGHNLNLNTNAIRLTRPPYENGIPQN